VFDEVEVRTVCVDCEEGDGKDGKFDISLHETPFYFVFLRLSLKQGQAAEVIQCVLDHGKLRQPEIISALGLTERKGMILFPVSNLSLFPEYRAQRYLNAKKPSTNSSHHSTSADTLRYTIALDRTG
jgi:hypothetical protein